MKIVDISGRNVVIAENDENNEPTPACWEGAPQGKTTVAYEMTFAERLKVFITGKLFISQLTFGKQFHPMVIHTEWTEPKCGQCGAFVSKHVGPSFKCPK